MRSSLLIAAVAAAPLANAVKLPFVVHHATTRSQTLHTRADVNGSTNSDVGIPLKNTQNAFYLANVTLGQENKRVMLDSGSSDLWVTGDVTGTIDSGKAVTLSYAVGKAHGDVNYAKMTFDNFVVDNQAYLLVKDTSTFTTDISTQGYDGLMGLGPNSGSVIRKEFDKAPKADTVMSRIFQQNKTTANYITFLLDRVNDPTDAFTGQFTIGELAKGFESISSQPKVLVDVVHKLTSQDQHWQIPIDKDGFIGPDGQPIKYKSIVHGSDDRLIAVFDSGFTFPQVPRKMSDAIYGRVQGAKYDVESEMWTIPCDQELNITIKFGGMEFPVHPLDTNDDNFQVRDDSGKRVCLGSFQPITSAFSLLGEFDIILGMSFMRNVYSLMDFGKFVDGSSNDRGDPYMQLLSVTNKAAAHADFVQVRLNGVDTTGDSKYALLPESQGQSSPESEAEKKQQLAGKVLRQWPYIFLGCLAFFAIMVGLIVWKCCCHRKKAKEQRTSLLPLGSRPYKPLEDPAPPSMSMQNLGQYQDPYRASQHH